MLQQCVWAVSAQDSTATVFDAHNGKTMTNCTEATASKGCAALVFQRGEILCFPSGLVLFDEAASCLKLFSNKQAKPVSKSFTKEKITALVSCTSKDLLIAGTKTGSLLCWRQSTGEFVAKIAAHIQNITALNISFDSAALVSGCCDGEIGVWQVDSFLACGAEVKPISCLRQHFSEITSLNICGALVSTGRIFVTYNDGTLSIYDLISATKMISIKFAHPLCVSAVSAVQDLVFVATECVIYSISFLGLSQQSQQDTAFDSRMVFAECKSPVSTLAVTFDDSCLISGFKDGSIITWNIDSKIPLCKVFASNGAISNLLLFVSVPGMLQDAGDLAKVKFEQSESQKHTKLFRGKNDPDSYPFQYPDCPHLSWLYATRIS